MQAYNPPFRYPGDNSRSVNEKILMGQLSIVATRTATAGSTIDHYIPCDIKDPQHITLSALDATTADILRQGATTAALGIDFNELNLATAASVAGQAGNDYASSVNYVKGQIVNDPADAQYICIKDYTAVGATTATLQVAFNRDVSSGYWKALAPKGGWIRMSFAPNAASKKARFSCEIKGYNY